MAAQRRGSVEGLGPPAEGLVGGDGDAVLLLSLGQGLEEQFGAVPVEFHVSEFVDEGTIPGRSPPAPRTGAQVNNVPAVSKRVSSVAVATARAAYSSVRAGSKR